ncbi:MAG: hypothetical protein K6E13_04545 [Lachnospiraceae bacterium]|nr:hypothetical protein [Lachnospiraceae bacterium]
MSDWKDKTVNAMRELIKKYELYEDALYLSANYEKNNKEGKAKSYTISLWEKDYPEITGSVSNPDKNFSVVNITEKDKTNELKMVMGINILRTNVLEDVPIPDDMVKSDTKSIYWTIDKNSDNFEAYIKSLMEYALIKYESKASAFGCCSLYKKCSEAGKCIHINKIYSKSCGYRKNLEGGNIFYA